MNLAAVFNLALAKALAWFQAKGLRITPQGWREMEKGAHARAFTIARVTALDVLGSVKAAVEKAIGDGLTFEQFKKELEPRLKQTGWWTDDRTGEMVAGRDDPAAHARLNTERLRLVYKANVSQAYARGRMESMQAAVADRPFWQYVSMDDDHVRAAHRSLHGLVFAHDDPFWDTHAPPNGFNCRCLIKSISAKQVAERGLAVSESDGRIVESTYHPKNGDPIAITGFKAPDGTTVYPDPGWDTSPLGDRAGSANAALEDLAKRKAQALGIAQGGALKKLLGWVGFAEFANPHHDEKGRFTTGDNAAMPKPTVIDSTWLLPAGLPQSVYADAFLNAFGASTNRPATFVDKTGTPLVITSRMVTDATGGLKSDKHGRGIYAKLAADAIKNPDEIWEDGSDLPHGKSPRRRYLKVYSLAGRTEGGIAVFELDPNSWTGVTAFRADGSERNVVRYLRNLRKGKRVYAAKK